MTNNEARGYAILAARAVGVPDHLIKAMYDALPRVFDEYTEQEAENRGDRIIVNIPRRG